MDAEKFDQFNALVLQLYRIAAEVPLEHYQDAVLDALKPLLAFDSAMWGTATYVPDKGLDIHRIHLYHQPVQMIEEYDEFKHLDLAAVAVSGPRQVTKGFDCDAWFQARESRPYREFQKRFDIGNVLITANTRQDTGASQWLSLFRADSDHLCEDAHTQLLAQLAPHIMQGLNHSLARQLDRTLVQNNPHGQEAAIADPRGIVHYATPGSEALLRLEWPAHFQTGRIPAPLMEWASTEQAPFVGRHIVARANVRKDLMFLHLRPCRPADHLPPRQNEVAQLLIQGLTYKEIAARLSRAPATVRTQIRQIYERLEVNNVAQLALILQTA
jgi:DNA-binding CsgD family transcriptional regulator